MSGTPETDDIARGNHVVPVEWGQQLERERDEAREKAERYRLEANAMMLQRDESQEKYATEATEHMLAINKLCNERDDAREEARLLKAILDLLKKEAQ